MLNLLLSITIWPSKSKLPATNTVELIIDTFPLITVSPETKYSIFMSIDGKGVGPSGSGGLDVWGADDGSGDKCCVGDGGGWSEVVHGKIEHSKVGVEFG